MPFNGRHITREYAGGSVGGILRKGSSSSTNANTTNAALSAGEARQVDLLVFGYACKIFRDDEKARDIDQGKHLIPWMGDNSLKIDRYDVRGALSDLAPHEPPPGGYGNRLEYLSADEQRAEQLCEEERYLFLYNNEEEHILQQEEDLKRLKQDCDGVNTYNQVAFQYDSLGAAAGSGIQHGPNPEHSPNDDDQDQQAFVLPKNFEVPVDIQLPETMKQHAIIEKTARFIATQGVQMEILLKAKQSNNVQFEFLTQDSLLNPYYKFVVNAIKLGTYPAEELTPAAQNTNNESANDINSLTTATLDYNPTNSKTVITVPTIKYKPSANCAYTQLISKIKGVPLPDVLAADSNDNLSGTNTPTTPVLLQYNGSTYVQAENDDSNSIIAANSNSNSNSNSNGPDNNLNSSQPQVELLKNSSAFALAQDYASDTESEAEVEAEVVVPVVAPIPPPKPEPILNFPIPAENLKNIIDKTATYVIKNGRQFEETLRTKSEERFTFLLPDSEYYPYYMYKITDDPDAASKEQKKRKAAAVAAALLSKKGVLSEKTVSPVSFSIRTKDDHSTAALQPGLPQEPSDDEDENKRTTASGGNQLPRTVPEHVQKAIQLVESQLMARNAQMAATAASTTSRTAIGNGTSVTSSSSSSKAGIGGGGGDGGSAVAGKSSSSSSSSTTTSTSTNTIPYGTSINVKNQMSSTKAELERNALFEQQQQNRQKELKKAEEKVKDKLAQIAREKLGGLITKEKQLQLERKRKAMAFLNQIKGEPNPVDNDNSNEKKRKCCDEMASDDSNASIHSIPITSFGPDDKTDYDDVLVRNEADAFDDDVDDVVAGGGAGAGDAAAIARLKKLTKKQLQRKLENPLTIANPANKTKTLTVTLSDDDDVEVVSETKGTTNRSLKFERGSKRRSRSKTRQATESINKQKNYRKRSASASSSTSSSSTDGGNDNDDDYDNSVRNVNNDETETELEYRSKSSAHKSSGGAAASKKSKKSMKSRKHHKKKSKKHNRRSRSRSYSRQRSKSHRHSRSPATTALTNRHHYRHEDEHKQEQRHHRRRSYSSCSANSVRSSSESHNRQQRHKKHNRERSSSTSARRKEKKRKYDR